MMYDRKIEEINDKIEELNAKIELIDQKFILVTDLLYSIRTATLDTNAKDNGLDSADWMNKLAEVYPSMYKFKKLSNRTYISHGEYMNNLYIASKKYEDDFVDDQNQDQDEEGTDGPDMIDKNSY